MDNDLYQIEEYPPGHGLAVQGLVAAKMVGFLRKLAHDFLCLIYFYNIQELREQKAKLRLARKKLRKDARSAKHSRREIKEDVEKWLADTMKSLKDWRSLEEQIQANQTSLISRLNWSQRCRLSSEIECLKQDMLHYVRTIDFDGAVLAMRLESDFATDFKPSQSLKSALFEVVNAMNVASTDSGMIAVCGPRGVGKTSLAIQLEKKAKDILNFQVLRLVVSQSTTTEQVQDKFAAFLGLNLQNKRAEERAQLLRRELETKRGILIILDNVCSCRELNLESIGISNRMSCKVVVTASDDRELRSCSITTSKVIRLGHLDKAEAWELLEENLSPGTSSDIKEVGKRIAEEFEHSTVSIVTLGRGLRGKDYDDWMKAYKRLESKPKKGEKKGIKIVYRCVKLSYDYLTELKKHCFLLCSIFPDDYAIALEDLKRYSWGLGIYQGIDSIETVTKKVDGAIKTLTKSFLLLQHGKAHVRMTNVVRDAALLIASKDKFLRIKSRVGSWEGRKNENLDSYTVISYVASQQELRDMEFPTEKLRILFLDGYGYKIHHEFLHRLTALKVVAIHHGVLSIIALRDLMSLKALHLEHCKLDVLSSLGELQKLEILSFRGSDISELPDQIGELKYLILLDLSDCQKLQRVPLNLIRRLSRLEELYFSGRSFEEWWSNERRMRINSLPSLATESFENQGSGNRSKALKVSALFGNESSVTLLARDSILVADNNVVPNLVQKVENMKVQNCDKCLEDICRLSDLVGIRSGQILENLTTLELKDCSKLKSLFSVTLAQSLSKLETLEIHGCKGLEQIIAETTVDVDVSVEFIAEATEEVDDGVDVRAETTDEVDIGVDEATGRVDANVISGGNESIHRRYLPSLNTLLITDCNRLKSIFQVPKGQVFPKLTRLEISNCFRLEAVFSTKEVEEQNICEVPVLERLKLEGLMSLRKFSPDNLSIKLPKLQQLEVGGCRSLSKDAMFELIGNRRLKEFRLFKMRNELCESIFDYEGGCLLACLEVLKLHDLNELQCIWKVSAQMVTLQKLEHLEVVRCNKLKNLFSLLLARNLLSLRKLIVRECDELEKLIGLDQITSSPPPPSSSSSSSGYKPVYFPNLEELSLEGCNELKSLFPASVACLPSLKKFSVRRALALVDVFGNGEGDARAKRKKEGEGDRARAKTKKIEFRKLETFLLEELPSLVNFNPVDYYCEFTIKKSFQVKACNSTIVTKFEMRDSAPNLTVYTKTNDPRMLRPLPVVDMPTHNGDIDWSPGMKVN